MVDRSQQPSRRRLPGGPISADVRRRAHRLRLLFCATKSTADLLEHLLQMERWVTKTVPGGRFMVIRSDFGSELVRQGHGSDMVVEAHSRWCASRPGFRVWPVAPHSPSQNKTENSWSRVHGHAFCNTLRFRRWVVPCPLCSSARSSSTTMSPPRGHPTSAPTQVVQAVSFPSSPGMMMGLLADSGLYAPHGTLTAPPMDIHTARLRRLLAPEDDLDSAVVVTDRLTGLPLSVVHMVPMEAEDGPIVMLRVTPSPPRPKWPRSPAPLGSMTAMRARMTPLVPPFLRDLARLSPQERSHLPSGAG
jgi:hypothetical protein